MRTGRLASLLFAAVLAGVAFAAVAVGAGPSATEPRTARTLLALTVPISQFAQDGVRLAWMTGRCKNVDRPVDYVALRTVSAGRRHVLAPKVCGWDPASPSGERFGDTGLALSGTTALFWSPVEGGNFTYHRLATATLGDRNVKTFRGYIFGTMGGEYVAGAGGEGGVFVHAIAGGEVTNECLGEPIPCEYRSGGRVFRVAARRQLRIPGVPVPAALDASGTQVAVAPAAQRWSQQKRVRVAQLSTIPTALNGGVQVRDLRTGRLRVTFAPRGRVLDLALAGDAAAVLVDTDSGLRIERYAATSGRLLATARVADSAQDGYG